MSELAIDRNNLLWGSSFLHLFADGETRFVVCVHAVITKVTAATSAEIVATTVEQIKVKI